MCRNWIINVVAHWDCASSCPCLDALSGLWKIFSVHVKIRNSQNVRLSIWLHNFYVPYDIFWKKCFFFSTKSYDQYFFIKHEMNSFQPILCSEKDGNWRYWNVLCLYRWLREATISQNLYSTLPVFHSFLNNIWPFKICVLLKYFAVAFLFINMIMLSRNSWKSNFFDISTV